VHVPTPEFAVVWLDREEARLTHFSEEQMRRERVRATRHDHHTHRLEGDEKESLPFYREVAHRLSGSGRILILGPGLAKTHFRALLDQEFPGLARQVVGCETVDHPSDGEITAYAARFFRVAPLRKVP
jgi:stalled ribosome rescue protein Dom34